MTDTEHEEWLRDREDQRNPPQKHIIVGGLQTDASDKEGKDEHTDAPNEGAEDDDEPENDSAENEDASK